MLNINITHFRKNIFDLLEQTIRFNEPINVTTKNGNAVVLSEEDYNGLMETLHLSSIHEGKGHGRTENTAVRVRPGERGRMVICTPSSTQRKLQPILPI